MVGSEPQDYKPHPGQGWCRWPTQQPDVQVISQPRLEDFRTNVGWFPLHISKDDIYDIKNHIFINFCYEKVWLPCTMYWNCIRNCHIREHKSLNHRPNNWYSKETISDGEINRITHIHIILSSTIAFITPFFFVLLFIYQELCFRYYLSICIWSKGLALCQSLWLQVCPGYFRVWVVM